MLLEKQNGWNLNAKEAICVKWFCVFEPWGYPNAFKVTKCTHKQHSSFATGSLGKRFYSPGIWYCHPWNTEQCPLKTLKCTQRPFQLKLGIFAVQIWKQAPNWDEHTNTHKSINDYEKYTLKLRTGIIKVQIVFLREGIPCHVKFGRVLYFACSSHVALTFGGQCTFCRDIPLRHLGEP